MLLLYLICLVLLYFFLGGIWRIRVLSQAQSTLELVASAAFCTSWVRSRNTACGWTPFRLEETIDQWRNMEKTMEKLQCLSHSWRHFWRKLRSYRSILIHTFKTVKRNDCPVSWMNQGSIKWISYNELDIVRPILSLPGGHVFQSIWSWGVESPTLCQVLNSGIIWWDSFNAQVLWVKLPGSRSPQTKPYSDWMLLSGSIWVIFYRSSHSYSNIGSGRAQLLWLL